MLSEDAARLGEAAPPPVALDETLSGRGLEQTEMLARRRLADPDRLRRRRDASLPLELDEKTESRRVPEERERLGGSIGGRDEFYREIRLARSKPRF